MLIKNNFYQHLYLPTLKIQVRAERILRVATVELFLAFVAGALRRHFRSQVRTVSQKIQMLSAL